MGGVEIEGIAESIYKMGRLEPEETSIIQLAHALLGEDAVEFVWYERLPGDGALALRYGLPCIKVRAGISRERKRFALAHELAEWWLASEQYTGEDAEDIADALGAALLVPRINYVDALRSHGRNWSALAKLFGTTETCVVLRFGEIFSEPLRLVTPVRIRERGEFYERESARIERLAEDPRRMVLWGNF